jgi:hypothetical protein
MATIEERPFSMAVLPGKKKQEKLDFTKFSVTLRFWQAS